MEDGGHGCGAVKDSDSVVSVTEAMPLDYMFGIGRKSIAQYLPRHIDIITSDNQIDRI